VPNKLIAEAIGVLLALALLGGLWAHGYHKGKAAVEADMAALRQAYALEQAADKGRYEAQIKALSVRNSQIEDTYAKQVSDLGARAADAESRYSRLLVAFATGGRTPGPAVPAADSAGHIDAAASADLDARARSIAGGLTRIAEGCEADAARLSALQDWAKGLQQVY
jgi:hypothetical protein